MNPIKGALLLALVFVISVSLTSGLELSVSTGGSGRSSSMNMKYGAETIDTVDQEIKANPGQETLENHIYGTGTLWGSSNSIWDWNGNYASVYRQVIGIPSVTSYNYDWSTYYPYSSSAGYGVGASLWLNANNAVLINANAYASNREGDVAKAYTDSLSYTSSASIYNYYANAQAFTDLAKTSQNANAASSYQGSTKFGAWSQNNEGDYTEGSTYVDNGIVYSPYDYSAATRTYAKTINDAWSGASGNIAEVNAKAENEAPAVEHVNKEHVIKNTGGTEFAFAKKNNNFLKAYTSSYADKGSVSIYSPTNAYKSAIVLTPFQWEFVVNAGAIDLRNTVVKSLKDKEYAVSYFRDSAVTKDRVGSMDDYQVALINTHANPTSLAISTPYIRDTGTTCVLDHESISSADLSGMFTNNKNWLTILEGCNTFGYENSAGVSQLANAVSGDSNGDGVPDGTKAWLAGGFKESLYAGADEEFISKFFERMATGQTARQANEDAYNYVKGKYWYNSELWEKLVFAPSNHDMYL